VIHAKTKQTNIALDRRHAAGGRCRHDDHGCGGATGNPHPPALLPPRPEPGRLVPRLHRRCEGNGLLHGGVQLAGVGRHGGADQFAAIRQARRDIVELLLDNHNMDCQTCERDGRCELQNLAYSMGVRARHFEGRRKRFPIELSSHSVVRDSEKCVLCGRCVRVCAEIQGVYNLSQHGRGFNTVVGPAHVANMDDSVCIPVRQCINVCPTAAFWKNAAPARSGTRLPTPRCTSWCRRPRRSGRPSARGSVCAWHSRTGQMITALRRLGFDRVFDTDFGADLTIIEEAHEFLTRLQAASPHLTSPEGEGTGHPGPLPMITSCSPGWINFLEKFYPELIPHASTCRSPMMMLSVLSKTYYAEKAGIDPKKISWWP